MKSFFLAILTACLFWSCANSEELAVKLQQRDLPGPSVVVAYNNDTQWALAWEYQGKVRVFSAEGTKDVGWKWEDRSEELIARVAEEPGEVFGARYE